MLNLGLVLYAYESYSLADQIQNLSILYYNIIECNNNSSIIVVISYILSNTWYCVLHCLVQMLIVCIRDWYTIFLQCTLFMA